MSSNFNVVMQIVIALLLIIYGAFGCSVAAPLPTFDEYFQRSEFVISGRIVAGPVVDLFCPDTGMPEYGFNTYAINSTAVVNVACVHKGTITCATQSGYLVKGIGEVREGLCLVHIHNIDTFTSCQYGIKPGDLRTFHMKADGKVGNDVINKQCYDSTYALENFVYSAITTKAVESCPYTGSL